MRDGATLTGTGNLENVDAGTFAAWYRAPLIGDLEVIGDVSMLVGAGPAHAQVTDDYCVRARPGTGLTLGALEHALGTCDVTGDATLSDEAGPGGGGGGGDPGGCCQSGRRPSALLIGLVAVMLGWRRRRR